MKKSFSAFKAENNISELTMADVQAHKEHIKATAAMQNLNAKAAEATKRKEDKEREEKYLAKKAELARKSKSKSPKTDTELEREAGRITGLEVHEELELQEALEDIESLEEIYNSAKVLSVTSSGKFLGQMLSEYPSHGKKKTFLEFTVENNCNPNSHLFESMAGKSLIASMVLRLRSKLTDKTKPVDQAKVIADLVALSAMYTSQSFAAVIKEIQDLKAEIKKAATPNNMIQA